MGRAATLGQGGGGEGALREPILPSTSTQQFKSRQCLAKRRAPSWSDLPSPLPVRRAQGLPRAEDRELGADEDSRNRASRAESHGGGGKRASPRRGARGRRRATCPPRHPPAAQSRLHQEDVNYLGPTCHGGGAEPRRPGKRGRREQQRRL